MTLSKIRKRLILDHFYLPVTSIEFAGLSPLLKTFKGSQRLQKKLPGNHWKGIYIFSRTGAYFELVSQPGSANFGMAVSAFQPCYCDVKKIADEFPGLPWAMGTQKDSQGKKSYDFLTVDSPVRPPQFLAFAINYRCVHQDNPSSPAGLRTVDRFISIHLTAGRERRLEIKKLTSWLPGVQSWSPDQAQFKLPDRDGSTFTIIIKFSKKAAPLKFRRLVMALNPGQTVRNCRIGKFSIFKKGSNTAILQINDRKS